MITNFFILELNNHDVQELWFQQDGTTCHTARATIDLLKDTFGDRLISRFGPVNWPPRSCDLTPLDYFLWGYAKSLFYADKPQTFDHLEDNIRRVIADIRSQMFEKNISTIIYLRIKQEMDDPGSHLIGGDGYCSQEVINLILIGKAVPNLFDGDLELNSGGSETTLLRDPAANTSIPPKDKSLPIVIRCIYTRWPCASVETNEKEINEDKTEASGV
ncbi:ubiquitin carboxyl-terminal hydrolase MINDY-4 [Trichonephila clavipes]|nr:ubiquitin carboxyl-terminal hydrolase MINDY-4 [Trichonephila clavipes]